MLFSASKINILYLDFIQSFKSMQVENALEHLSKEYKIEIGRKMGSERETKEREGKKKTESKQTNWLVKSLYHFLYLLWTFIYYVEMSHDIYVGRQLK